MRQQTRGLSREQARRTARKPRLLQARERYPSTHSKFLRLNDAAAQGNAEDVSGQRDGVEQCWGMLTRNHGQTFVALMNHKRIFCCQFDTDAFAVSVVDSK